MDEEIEEIQTVDTECNLIGRREHRYQDSLYTAYLVACWSFRYLLVYRQATQGGGATPELALSFSDLAICFDCALTGENWQDVNGDGRPDLIIGRGNNYFFANHVYRMAEDGAFQNLLEVCPFSQPGMVNLSFRDLGEDGAWELVAVDARWDYGQTDFFYLPAVSRLYALQACEYRDVSAAHPQFYQHFIDVFQRNYEYLRSGGGNREVTVFSAIEGLLACDAVGRRDACWESFWEMTDLEKYPLAAFQGLDPTPDAATLEFVHWVEALRLHLKEQYEAGLPFSPG